MAAAAVTWGRVKSSPRWTYADILLILEATLAGAALYISSHGVNTFFGFVMAADMAVAATVVLSLGIPVMESAWVLTGARIRELKRQLEQAQTDEQRAALQEEIKETAGQRNFFFGFMLALLFVEAVAQYLQGQAKFLPAVIEYFKTHAPAGASEEGIDLLTLAQNPYAGRLLAAMYLGSITGAVFFIIRATADRFASLRRVVAQKYTKRDHELELTLTVGELEQQLEQLKAEAERAGTSTTAAHRAAVEQLNRELEAARAEALEAGRERAEAEQRAALLSGQLEGKAAEIAALNRQLEDLRGGQSETAADARAARAEAQGAQTEIRRLELELERAGTAKQQIEAGLNRELADVKAAHARELEQLAMAHRAEVAEAVAQALQSAATVETMPDLRPAARRESPAERAGNGSLKPDAIALYERIVSDEGREPTGKEVAQRLEAADRVDYVTQVLSRYKADKKRSNGG